MISQLRAAKRSFAGAKCEGTITTFLGSKVCFSPVFLNSRMAIGAVTSFAITKSTLTSTRSPACTLGIPAWRAMIFSVIVIGCRRTHLPLPSDR